jgi:hypothetical protein
MIYGIIFWGNSSFSMQIFRIQKSYEWFETQGLL